MRKIPYSVFSFAGKGPITRKLAHYVPVREVRRPPCWGMFESEPSWRIIEIQTASQCWVSENYALVSSFADLSRRPPLNIPPNHHPARRRPEGPIAVSGTSAPHSVGGGSLRGARFMECRPVQPFAEPGEWSPHRRRHGSSDPLKCLDPRTRHEGPWSIGVTGRPTPSP